MVRTLYARYIEPVSSEPDQAARELVINYLLVSILVLAMVTLVDTTSVFIISRHSFLLSRIVSNCLVIIVLLVLRKLARLPRYHQGVAFVLMALVLAAGGLVIYQWGVLNSNGLLLLSLAVVIAGVLISSRYSLYLAGCITLLLLGLEYAETSDYSHPNLNWLNTKPTLGDMIGFSAILFIIALVSWLFNRQMELSLKRARRSEQALERQKALLEIKVKQRTEQLETTQLEQMQELYRFAELGRLSTVLFHDLANHLTSVSVDIEGLQQQNRSEIMQRIQANIKHVDVVVQRVRQQIQGKTTIEAFSINHEIDEVLKLLVPSAKRAGVTLALKPNVIRPTLLCKGDVMRFRQILLNIVANGIEAYSDTHHGTKDRLVTINLQRSKTELTISVVDHGVGIAEASLTKVFEPFYSTKAKGIGIGLFIAKQVVEHDFHGKITLLSNPEQGTVFSVSLPKSYYAKTARG